jgi:hypothetical protein
MENFKNPYSELGVAHTEGLDYVIKNIPANPKLEDINQIVCKFVQKKMNYSESTISNMELYSVIPHTYNAFINSDFGSFNLRQYDMIDIIYLWIKENPIEQIEQVIIDFESNVMKHLMMKEQLPLLLCSSIAKSSNNYWQTRIYKPDGWEKFFYSEVFINRSNIPFWVLASIQSTLFSSCFGKSTYIIQDPPQIAGPLFATTLTASIGITAGLVIFKWTPLIKLPWKKSNY